MSDREGPRLMTEVEAAAYCRVGKALFRELVEEGVFPAPFIKRGRLTLYDFDAINAFINRVSFPGSNLRAEVEALDREFGDLD